MTFSFDDLAANDAKPGWDEELKREQALSVSKAFFQRVAALLPANYEMVVAQAPISGVYYDRQRGVISTEEGERALDGCGWDAHPTITRKAIMAETWSVKVDPKSELEGLLRAWAYLRSSIPLSAQDRLLVGWYVRWRYHPSEINTLRARLWLLQLPQLTTLEVARFI